MHTILFSSILLCLCLNFAAFAQTAKAKLNADQLQTLSGSWEGTLTYLDYQNDKSKVTLKVKSVNQWLAPNLSRDVIFTEPNGKEIKSAAVTTVANDGKNITEDKLTWAVIKNAFDKKKKERTVVYEARGEDNDKPADLRKTLVIRQDEYTVTKTVRYQNTAEYFVRNEFRFLKVK